MVKAGMANSQGACSQEWVSLGTRRACRRIPELELLAACKMLASCQRRDVQTTLMASPAGNTDSSPRARFGWYYPLPTSVLARRDNH